MISNQFEEKAIQLVTVNEDGKYVLHPDGEQFISKVQKPIAVVSVAGLYRTGKSYLLNRMLLNRSNGFGVGPTINPCTKGLWCWGTPIKGTNSNGQKINVIIIDTQGIGALDQDQNHDTKIFTLAVLSASTFIYNSVGSIDETALQNLSLIVNLSKNIQINAQKSQDQQQDPQDLAQYFPSFCWVVRDFSLQLVTPNGEKITSKQYLEKALVQQKGFSDDIEEKNRIRRLLCAFFKQRDCMTMVRPLVNQAQLQNLQKLQFDDLRSQFVQQVLYLRKKILTKINPKTFKGKQLDGQMYLHILKSYIDAINDGAVPSIETAWTYMCQQKCMKAQQECWENFQQEVELFLSNRFPVSEQELNFELSKIQEECLKKFSKDCVGQASQDFLQELKHKIKHKIREVQIQNQKQSISLLKTYVIKNFESIQKRFKSNQFQSFQDYLKCINIFAQNLKQKGPNYPKRDLVFLEFTKKFIAQGAQKFIKNLSQNFQSNKSLWQEMKSNLQKKIEDLKSQLSGQVKSRKEKIKQLDWENGELIRNLQTCRSQINRMKQNQERQKQATEIKMKQKTKQFQKHKTQLLSQISQVKYLITELQSQKYKIEKELQKTQAISEQRIKQIYDENSFLKEKTSKLQIQLNQIKYDTNSRIQEITFKYQEQIKKSHQQKKYIQDAFQDLKDENMILLENISNLQSQLSSKVQKMSLQIKLKTEQLLSFKKKSEQELLVIQQSYQEQIEAEKRLRLQFQQKQILNASKLSEINQKIRFQQTKHQKQIAVLNQNLSFMKLSISQSKQFYQTKISSYQEKINQLQEMNKQMIEQNESQKVKQAQFQMREQLNALNILYQTEKAKTVSQMEEIKNNKERLELDLKLLKNNMTNQSKNLRTIIEELQNELKIEREQRQSIQKNFTNKYEEKIQAYQKKIEQLQEEMQTIKDYAENEQRVGSMRSEQAVIQLKNYYEMEKESLQKKLLKQKQKYEAKINELKSAHEEQLRQKQEQFDEQFNTKFQQLDQKSHLDDEKISSLSYENISLKKMYEQLERKYTQQRQNFEKKQGEFYKKIQNLSKAIQLQKQASHSKIDDLFRQKNKLEKDLITFKHQKQEFSSVLKSKDQKIQKIKGQIALNISLLQKERQENLNKMTQITNEAVQKKINYEREIALKDQKSQFMARKMEETQKAFQALISNNQINIKKLKEDYHLSLKSSQQKKNQEILLLQEKCDKIKKSSKQVQNALKLKFSTLQKEYAIQKDKTSNLQARLKELQEKLSTDQQKYLIQINNARSSLIAEKKELVQKYESIKHTLSLTQNSKQQLLSTYERQKALWQNKTSYLEQVNQRSKKQMTQTIQKLTQNNTYLQKLRMQQKSLNESSSTEYITKIQKKYSEQVREISQNHTKKETEFEQIRKKLQGQIRSLTQKLAMEVQNKSQFSVNNERRMKQLIQKQKRQSEQLQRLKSQKQKTAKQSYQMIQKEKQNYKAKIQEKQEKLRVIQKQKSEMLFQFEKDRLKWNIQKQSLSTKIQDQSQKYKKMCEDNEKLKKEVEKYKADRRSSRTIHNISNSSRYISINKKPLQENSMLNMSINSNSTNQDRKSSCFDQSSILDTSITSNYTLKDQVYRGFDQISKIKSSLSHHNSYIRQGKSFSKAKDFGKNIKNKENQKNSNDEQHNFFEQY